MTKKNEEFAVECKWRKNWIDIDNGYCLDLGNEEKINWYRDFAVKRSMPVFLVIGLGGSPDNPLEMFCVPLNEVNTRYILPQTLYQHRHYPNKQFFWRDGILQ